LVDIAFPLEPAFDAARQAELGIVDGYLAGLPAVSPRGGRACRPCFSSRSAELTIANKGLEQFSYIASHDLQEPLRTVANYMQVFEEDYLHLLDDNARKYLQSVNSAVKRMSMLVKSLLDFSRLGHSTKLSFVDCKAVVDVVISDLETMIRTSNADIEVFEMPHLNVYEVEIRQVFQNLIVNAIKFRREGSRPRIEIRSEKIAEGWRFSVADNGIGISPATSRESSTSSSGCTPTKNTKETGSVSPTARRSSSRIRERFGWSPLRSKGLHFISRYRSWRHEETQVYHADR
jgi:light-regulated signal transduction histidine kinase (bacteriophytochrome)